MYECFSQNSQQQASSSNASLVDETYYQNFLRGSFPSTSFATPNSILIDGGGHTSNSDFVFTTDQVSVICQVLQNGDEIDSLVNYHNNDFNIKYFSLNLFGQFRTKLSINATNRS
jgi:hypothetical protein